MTLREGLLHISQFCPTDLRPHETKNLLNSKGDDHLSEEAAYGIGKNLCHLYITEG